MLSLKKVAYMGHKLYAVQFVNNRICYAILEEDSMIKQRKEKQRITPCQRISFIQEDEQKIQIDFNNLSKLFGTSVIKEGNRNLGSIEQSYHDHLANHKFERKSYELWVAKEGLNLNYSFLPAWDSFALLLQIWLHSSALMC